MNKIIKRVKTKLKFMGKGLIGRTSSFIYDINVKRKGDEYLILKAKKRFKRKLGKEINWDNPQTLNEIINKNKILADTTLWSKLADKYSVREFVESRGLKETLVKIYGVWSDPDQIDFETLPNSFVLKANNGSASVLIVKNKSTLDIYTTKILLKSWVQNKFGYNSIEPHYLRIKPLIIAEELLIPQSNDKLQESSLIDYKWYCINGKPTYALVASNRVIKGHKYDISMYDTKWQNHSHLVDTKRRKIASIPRPNSLDRMLQICETLSQNIPFVRVDLYEVNGKVYFGELTFTPDAGYSKNATEEFDQLMGEIYRKANPSL